MYVCHTTKELRNEVSRVKKEGKSIGLVTTMGALHEGHASLIKAARAENDFVIVTVFVNPTQFGPTEDYAAYPRTLESDCKMAEREGADLVFAPAPGEMYPHEDMTWVEVTVLLRRSFAEGHDLFIFAASLRSVPSSLTSPNVTAPTTASKTLSRPRSCSAWLKISS